jgi:hypothetical protein
VIASADFIHHAIPSHTELEVSVNRLAAAGLVTARGTAIRPTRAGRQVVRRAARGIGIVETPRRILSQLEGHVQFPGIDAGWSLADSDWQAAYDRYYPPEKRGAA